VDRDDPGHRRAAVRDDDFVALADTSQIFAEAAPQLSDPDLHGTKCTPNLTIHAHKARQEIIAWPPTVVRMLAVSQLPPNTETARTLRSRLPPG